MLTIENRAGVDVLVMGKGCRPASEAEIAFYAEITRLRAEVASLTAQLQSGESFHAVAVRQRDAAWREVEALKATLTQQCKGFRADVEKLEAEVEALRASAERWIYINERNGEWRRFEADGPDPAYSMLCVRLPYDADLSCRATREIAIDAARAAPQMTDAEMVRAEALQSIIDEIAHAAYLRGIEEGKRQATTPQDRSAPARREDMTAFAAELKADPAKAQSFFQSAGLIDERGELMPEYAAPQQAGQFDHLAGRGMHELRFDELTPYVLSLLAGRGQDTPDVRIAIDWIVSELKRKTNDERALAVKLDAIRAEPQQAEPVAWRDHVEQRMHNWRQRKMNRSGDRLALDDMMSKESIDDLIDYVCDEWSDPVAPQQAEPVAKIIRNDSGQVRMVDGSGEPFDMFAHVGQSYYAHPTPAEVQRLRDALEKIKLETFDDSAELIARRALEGKRGPQHGSYSLQGCPPA